MEATSQVTIKGINLFTRLKPYSSWHSQICSQSPSWGLCLPPHHTSHPQALHHSSRGRVSARQKLGAERAERRLRRPVCLFWKLYRADRKESMKDDPLPSAFQRVIWNYGCNLCTMTKKGTKEPTPTPAQDLEKVKTGSSQADIWRWKTQKASYDTLASKKSHWMGAGWTE